MKTYRGRMLALSTLVATGLLLGTPALAAPPDHAKGKEHGEHGKKGGSSDDDEKHGKSGKHGKSEASDAEDAGKAAKSIVEGFLGSYWADGTPRSQPMPPGLAKQGKVPPGIAAQIERGKRLPDGAGTEIPQTLRNMLKLGQDVGAIFSGSDVVMYNRENREIVDVLRGVVR